MEGFNNKRFEKPANEPQMITDEDVAAFTEAYGNTPYDSLPRELQEKSDQIKAYLASKRLRDDFNFGGKDRQDNRAG